MLPIPQKTDGSTTLSAAEFNSLNDELQNVIKVFLAVGGPNFQIAQSISNHVSAADFYIDGGVADAYSLTKPVVNVQSVTSFLDGMRVRFFALNTNTGSAGGVTIFISGMVGVQDVKKFNGDVLSAGEIAVGEMTELVYIDSLAAFVVSSSSQTRMITRNTTIIVAASGGEFTTLNAAYESLQSQYILDSITVTIEIQGKITETLTTVISHSEAKNIKIKGDAELTVNMNAVNSVGGGAGAFSIEYQISAALTGAVIGDYVFIHNTIAGGANAEKEYNRKHEGLWEITAITPITVTVTNTFGFGAPDSPNTSDILVGLDVGKITFLPTQITYSTDKHLEIKNTVLGSLQNIVIINNVAGISGAVEMVSATANTEIDTDTFFGIVSDTKRALVMSDSRLIEKNAIIVARSSLALSLEMMTSSIQNANTIILNGSANPTGQALVMEDSYIGGFGDGASLPAQTELIATGYATGGDEIGVFVIQGGRLHLAKLVTIVNRSLGILMTGGNALIDTIIASDNAQGIRLIGGAALAMQNATGKLIVLDNERGTGSNEGISVTQSVMAVGRVLSTGIPANLLLIDVIKISGQAGAVGPPDVNVGEHGSVLLMGVVVNSDPITRGRAVGGSLIKTTLNVPNKIAEEFSSILDNF